MKHLIASRWFAIAIVSIAAHVALALVPMLHLPDPHDEQVLLTVSLRPVPLPEPDVVEPPPPTERQPPPEPTPPPRPRTQPRKVAKAPAEPKTSNTPAAIPRPEISEETTEHAPVETAPLQIAQVAAPEPEVDIDAYLGRLASAIERHKRYPRQARVMGMEGVVVVSVRVTRTGGKVGRIEIVRSSGFDLLDREALRMVGAAAFPAASRLPSDPFPMHIPVRFAMASR